MHDNAQKRLIISPNVQRIAPCPGSSGKKLLAARPFPLEHVVSTKRATGCCALLLLRFGKRMTKVLRFEVPARIPCTRCSRLKANAQTDPGDPGRPVPGGTPDPSVERNETCVLTTMEPTFPG